MAKNNHNNSCSLLVIYRKRNYNIYQAGNDYIVHNTNYEFAGHHTHLNSFSTAKYILNLSLQKSIPKHICDYFLESLIRISDDNEYKYKLKALQCIDKSERYGTSYKDKKSMYFNPHKKKNIKERRVK